MPTPWMDEAEIVAQQFRKRAHFAVHTHFLQLRATEKLEGMFEDARHFPRCCRHASNRHDRMPIDFQHLVRAVVDDSVAGRVARRSPATKLRPKLERQDCRRLCRHPG